MLKTREAVTAAQSALAALEAKRATLTAKRAAAATAAARFEQATAIALLEGDESKLPAEPTPVNAQALELALAKLDGDTALARSALTEAQGKHRAAIAEHVLQAREAAVDRLETALAQMRAAYLDCLCFDINLCASITSDRALSQAGTSMRLPYLTARSLRTAGGRNLHTSAQELRDLAPARIAELRALLAAECGENELPF